MALSVINRLTTLWLLLLTTHSILCEENEVKKKKVCVIGAGPCGLCSVRQLSALPNEFEPVAFERNSDIGGLWIYTDETDLDEHGLPVHSSMYKILRTNGPKELMTYPDYRDFQGEHSSVSHEAVLEYLMNYTDHFNLRQYIKFNTLVEKVSPIPEKDDQSDKTKWLVETRNLTSDSREETVCDAVMVCNGNLFEPNIPKIPGMEKFPGRVLHSHSYRIPDEFAGERVVVLGASFSGTDIGIQISDYAKTVYLSHRHDKIPSEFPTNMEQVAGVVEADGNQLILSDGSKIVADSFLYCTGYRYSFPFLDATSGIVVDDGKFVHPLYKDLINANHTTMSFLGLERENVGFATYDLQARYFISLLRGLVVLPSYEEMLNDSELHRDKTASDQDSFGSEQWDYYADLAQAAGIDNLPPFYENGFKLWASVYFEDLLHFRDYDLRVLDDEHVEIFKWKNT